VDADQSTERIMHIPNLMVLTEFAACSDTDFAYPTQRFYNNAIEDKEGTRPQ
jgi:hypothetical protein